MKYKFEDSKYYDLWANGEPSFLQTFVDEVALLRTNFSFWENEMDIAQNPIPTAADGTATFTVAAIESKAMPMADMRAPLGDSAPIDTESFNVYSAPIPDFITPGFVEKATEREYKERLYAQYGRDTELVLQLIRQMQNQKDSADQTMSNLTAQVESTGRITYNFGRGIHSPIYQVPLKEKNFKKAGAAVWSAPTAKLLDQMVEIQKQVEDESGKTIARVWKIPYDMFTNIFLKNEQVKEWINYMFNMNNVNTYNVSTITPELFNQYVVSYPGLAPIEIVTEKQINGTWTSLSDVQGWKEGIAVLRPAGKAGIIQYTDNLDEYMFNKYGNNIVQKTFAKVNTIYTIVNTTLVNGLYKEWHTDLMFSAVPALNQWLDHIIVDTTEAG